MKKIKLILLLIVLTMGSFQGYSQFVSQNGRLQVSGSRIVNKNNQPFSVAGNSFFWSGFQNDGGKFYTAQTVNHLANDWKSGVIRAAMAVEQADGNAGYIRNPAEAVRKVQTVVDAAIANDIYAIIDFHTHNAHQYESQAIQFFTDMARRYKDRSHVIYEIYNEPIGGSSNQQQQAYWNNTIKPYAQRVINEIRKIDDKNLIIVGTPFYSQGVEAAAANPIAGDPNLAYTLHFYAGTHTNNLRNKATNALRTIPLFVTEWGSVNADGNGGVNTAETNNWMQFLANNNLSHANWSVSDKAEGASIIQSGQGINGLIQGRLTNSGNLVRGIIRNWEGAPSGGGSTGGNSTNYYFIQHKVSKRFIRPVNATENSPIAQAPNTWRGNWTQWRKVPTSGGYFRLQNKQTNKYLRSPNGTSGSTVVNAGRLDTSAEWREVTPNGDNGYVFLRNRNSNMHFRPKSNNDDLSGATGNNFTLEQRPSTFRGDLTRWRFVRVGSSKSIVEEINSKVTINVYPNPASGILNVATNKSNKLLSVSLISLSGKIVYQNTLNTNISSIDVSGLSSGVYVLKTLTASGQERSTMVSVK